MNDIMLVNSLTYEKIKFVRTYKNNEKIYFSKN